MSNKNKKRQRHDKGGDVVVAATTPAPEVQSDSTKVSKKVMLIDWKVKHGSR